MGNAVDWGEAARRKGWSGLPDTPGNFGDWCRWWLHDTRSCPDDVTDEPTKEARRKFNAMLPKAVAMLLTLLQDSLCYDMEPDDERELLKGLFHRLPHQLHRMYPDDWTECGCGWVKPVGLKCMKCGK